MYNGVPTIWAKFVNSVRSVNCCPVALAMPKSITFGTGTPSCSVTSTLDGFRSRWMTPFWCACCTAWQTGTNRLQPIPHRQVVPVAELGDRYAADQLHDEIGPARLRRAAVEHLGDVGVIHDRQRLPLGLEPRDHLAGVHPRLDHLQRDLTPHRVRLLGHEDDSEPAFADLLQELVRPDQRPRTLFYQRQIGEHQDGRRRVLEETAGLIVFSQQCLQPLPGRGLAIACPVEKGATVSWGEFDGGLEYLAL